MKSAAGLLLALLVTAPGPAQSAPAEKRVAVLEFEVGRGVAIDRLYFSDRVRGAIGTRAPNLLVMTHESINVLLQAGTKLADCEGECEVETGRKLGADYVVSGRIGKIGSRIALTLRLHSTADGRLLRASEALAANTDALVDATLGAVDDLLTGLGIHPKAQAGIGTLKVLSDPPGAMVTVDGQPLGKTPFSEDVPGNATYLVTVEKAQFDRVEQKVAVQPGKTEFVQLTLRPKRFDRGEASGGHSTPPPIPGQECPKPTNYGQWKGPETVPPWAYWFRPAFATTSIFEVELTRVTRPTEVVLYRESGRTETVSSLRRSRGTFAADSKQCIAIVAYHKNGDDPGLAWLRTDGNWNTADPGLRGAWRYEFSDDGTAGLVTAAVH